MCVLAWLRACRCNAAGQARCATEDWCRGSLDCLWLVCVEKGARRQQGHPLIW